LLIFFVFKNKERKNVEKEMFFISPHPTLSSKRGPKRKPYYDFKYTE